MYQGSSSVMILVANLWMKWIDIFQSPKKIWLTLLLPVMIYIKFPELQGTIRPPPQTTAPANIPRTWLPKETDYLDAKSATFTKFRKAASGFLTLGVSCTESEENVPRGTCL